MVVNCLRKIFTDIFHDKKKKKRGTVYMHLVFGGYQISRVLIILFACIYYFKQKITKISA